MSVSNGDLASESAASSAQAAEDAAAASAASAAAAAASAAASQPLMPYYELTSPTQSVATSTSCIPTPGWALVPSKTSGSISVDGQGNLSIPQSGVYSFSVGQTFYNGANPGGYGRTILVNGGVVFCDAKEDFTGGTQVIQAACTRYFTSGSYIQLQVCQSSGVNLNVFGRYSITRVA